MKMNQLLTGAAVLLFSLTLSAQPGRSREERQEKIEAFKIAFFTEKLQLTPEESKAFWPLYNQYESEREALRKRYDQENGRIELMSDKEVAAFLDKSIEMEDQQVKLRKDYLGRFQEVLPIRKVALLQRIDREFKVELLREIREQRGPQSPPGNRRKGGR
jgi:hypothetical protein